jgi:hypothetical protein
VWYGDKILKHDIISGMDDKTKEKIAELEQKLREQSQEYCERLEKFILSHNLSKSESDSLPLDTEEIDNLLAGSCDVCSTDMADDSLDMADDSPDMGNCSLFMADDDPLFFPTDILEEKSKLLMDYYSSSSESEQQEHEPEEKGRVIFVDFKKKCRKS